MIHFRSVPETSSLSVVIGNVQVELHVVVTHQFSLKCKHCTWIIDYLIYCYKFRQHLQSKKNMNTFSNVQYVLTCINSGKVISLSFFFFFFYKSLGYFCWNCFPIVNFTFQQNTHVHPCLTNHMYITLQYLCTLTYMYKLCKSYFPFLICFHFFPGTVFLL